MPATNKLTWANIDPYNDAELDALRDQEEAEAAERVAAAVRELQQLGIIDANGRRISKDIPPDMREDSDCDFSAL